MKSGFEFKVTHMSCSQRRHDCIAPCVMNNRFANRCGCIAEQVQFNAMFNCIGRLFLSQSGLVASPVHSETHVQ